MKITRRQIRRLIREAMHGDGPEVDVQDAIQMLEAEPPSKSTRAIDVAIRILKEKGAKAAETAITILQRQEDPTGTLFHVINRLDVALEKVQGS